MMDKYEAIWLCVSFDFVLKKKKKEKKETKYSHNRTVEIHSDSEYDYRLY
jgi:hypothetical protein